MSRSSMDVTYFRQLQNLNRKIALQYKLAVPREEISARLAPHDAAVENRKEKHNVLSGYEKNKEATDEIQAAKAAYEIALEHERNERAKVLKYLESILDHIHLENQDNEIIQALMKCAILKDATPKGLADFCQESDYNAKIVQELLDSSPEIMKKMLVNGGAAGGNYGRSYSIYKHLLTMIDPDDKLYGPCHERLAMAVALEHGKPIEGFDTPDVFVNPFSRFEHYVKAHKAGELDPAFSYFSTWEYRHVVNCDATEGQLQWARDHLKRYRPDQIFMPDVAWRYAEAVRTDVGYRKANWTSQPKTYQQLVSGGGKCGPRAWYGRFICKAFGIPTWGVRQPGHAAMTRWTPTDSGWVTLLGAGWDVSHWQGRKGLAFRAEAHARAFLHGKEDEIFAKLTLLACMAKVHNEQIHRCEQSTFDGEFVWSSFLCGQRILLSERTTKNDFYRGPSTGESDERFPSQIRDYMMRKDTPREHKDIEIGADGSITISACATCSVANCQKMLSFEGGAQLFMEKENSSAQYRMPPTIGEPHNYNIVFQLCNIHLEQENCSLLITVNKSDPVQAMIPYTKGEWGFSYPVTLCLGKKDTIDVQRKGEKLFGLTIKSILLMKSHSDLSLRPVPNTASDLTTSHQSTRVKGTSVPMLTTQVLKDNTAMPSKTVKVFILLGQSNMLGMGKVNGADTDGSLEHAVKVEHKYPFLIDENGNWKRVIHDRVRNVFTMGSGTEAGKLQKNEWLTVSGNKIGPEIGIGYELGKWLSTSDLCRKDDDVLVLKSCIGNRSLGWDLLPPGSPSFEYYDEKKKIWWHYAGYKESPMRWEKGTKPKPANWYAGMQYDGDMDRAKKVLGDFQTYIPGAPSKTKLEIAGFFFWQGDKDRYDPALAQRYKLNLVHFITQLRRDFQAPNAKFVLATLGQTPMEGSKGNDAEIFKAQMSVQELPQFINNTLCVYSKPFCHGGASNSHYNGNAETYMDVGQAMGRAMVSLLEGPSQ